MSTNDITDVFTPEELARIREAAQEAYPILKVQEDNQARRQAARLAYAERLAAKRAEVLPLLVAFCQEHGIIIEADSALDIGLVPDGDKVIHALSDVNDGAFYLLYHSDIRK